ncbi:DUF1853 family protein [Marinobacterium aestuariivivens]|uniref:DUF1853 family protein n=1 Tax=Marinobacterium aestuariivivens TaxID=1698799 RepID=A0ABW2A7R1_9GAMM
MAIFREFTKLLNLTDTAKAEHPLRARLLREPDDRRRDCLWALDAPPLMKDALPGLAGLLTEGFCPQGSLAPSRHRRLGLYFEDVVGDILAASPETGRLYRNVQCREQGRTLGEFDFLFAAGARWYHLEAAVKFYLCVGDGSALNHFVGPGLRDRLDIKWQRLQQHQLLLSRLSAGQETIAPLGISRPDAKLLMQGYLFYRGGEVPGESLHPAINPGHLRGWWCTRSELAARPAKSGRRYALLQKLRWLSPARLPLDDTCDLDELRERLGRRDQPAMVVELELLGGPDLWGECGRGFVVPDPWPEKAAGASI